MTMTGGDGGRSPDEQIRTLREDSPRWHLEAAEDEIDAGRLDVARAALARARETLSAGADTDEAAFVAVRLAAASVDLKTATAEVVGLVERRDPADPVWNRRLRRIIEGAPRVFPRSMRAGLLDLLPPVPGDAASTAGSAGIVASPTLPDLPDEDEWGDAAPAAPAAAADSGDVIARPILPELPGEDDWGEVNAGVESDIGDGGVGEPAGADRASGEELPPLPTVSPFERARATRVAHAAEEPLVDRGVERGGDDVVVLLDLTLEGPPPPAGFSGRVTIAAEDADLTDADALRDRLVEEMLASVSDEEGQLLFETATTFLINYDFETAEVMFSAAMQLPELRVPACEGVMQSLVGAGRFVEAVATGARATRIFAREGDSLLGIVYLQGIAAQAVEDDALARSCFARVAASAHAAHFPDLHDRQAAVGC
jgi:hypothetical protein